MQVGIYEIRGQKTNGTKCIKVGTYVIWLGITAKQMCS